MLERIKSIICHPRYIGKYHNDKVWKILLYVFIFLVLYLAVFGVRTFTENPLGEEANTIIISDVISLQRYNVKYDSNTHLLTGEETTIVKESYGLYVLPQTEVKVSPFSVNIIMKEDKAFICQGAKVVSEIKYSDIAVGDFTFEGLSKNNPTDIYNFRVYLYLILESSFTYYRTLNFVQGAVEAIGMYALMFLLAFIFAKLINPTIEGKVRAKLVMYDTIIYFVVAILTCLFNVAGLIYVAYSLPIIYTSITFRHIVRVVVPKRGV